jgi:hypothetical protein
MNAKPSWFLPDGFPARFPSRNGQEKALSSSSEQFPLRERRFSIGGKSGPQSKILVAET